MVEFRKVNKKIIEEIVRLKDEENRTFKQIVEIIKEKYGIDLTERTVYEHYKRSKKENVPECNDPHTNIPSDLYNLGTSKLDREILKMYKEGFSPADAVIKLGAPLPVALTLYEIFIKTEKQYINNVQITQELAYKVLNTELDDDGYTLLKIMRDIAKLASTISNFRSQFRELSDHLSELASRIEALIERVDHSITTLDERVDEIPEIRNKLNALEQKLGNIDYSLHELLAISRDLKKNSEKSIFDTIRERVGMHS